MKEKLHHNHSVGTAVEFNSSSILCLRERVNKKYKEKIVSNIFN